MIITIKSNTLGWQDLTLEVTETDTIDSIKDSVSTAKNIHKELCRLSIGLDEIKNGVISDYPKLMTDKVVYFSYIHGNLL